MVTCVYLTDPAILNFIREGKFQIKKKYMYDYFSVRYQPGFDPDGTPSKEYPRILKLVPLENGSSENYKSVVRSSLINEEQGLNFIYHPSIELKQIHGIPTLDYNHINDKRYSIMTFTSKTGSVYLPNEVYDFESLKKSKSHFIPMRLTHNRKVIQVVPEKILGLDQPETSTSTHAKHTEMIETLVVYDNPCFAKCIHWVLLNVFRVKPFSGNDDDADENNKSGKAAQNPGPSKRVFRDFTNSSDPSIPLDYLDSTSVEEEQQLSNQGPSSLPSTIINSTPDTPNEILSSVNKLNTGTSGSYDHQLGTSSHYQQQDSSCLDVPAGSSMSGSAKLKTSLPPISIKKTSKEDSSSEKGKLFYFYFIFLHH
jgi:hypothetical protein